MAIRVVIVDDDIWVRRGRAQALGECPGLEVAGTLGHAEALAQDLPWASVDVVLVDAWDAQAGFDRFPGVAVVRAIRAAAPGGPPRIVVVTGHVFNDMLRQRMTQAGADLFYGHEDVADAERLAAVVSAAARPPAVTGGSAPGPAGLGQAGPEQAGPESALDWIQERGLEPAFYSESQKTVPFSRRTVGNIRREVGRRAGLAPTGQLPRWRAVVDFVNRARGSELRKERGEGP